MYDSKQTDENDWQPTVESLKLHFDQRQSTNKCYTTR